MIEGFTVKLQEDILQLIDYTGGKLPQNAEQDKKVKIAALRILGAIGMGLGLLIAASSVSVILASPIGAVALIAAGGFVYVASHDIHTMGTNMQKKEFKDQLTTVGKGLWRDLTGLWNGQKKLNESLRFKLTEGTILQPSLNRLLVELEAQGAS